MQTLIHYSLHLIFPIVLARLFFKENWKYAYLIMLGTMLVDLDHLLADPIFKANRCSIGYHYLHTHYAVLVYVVLLFFRKPFNIIGLGLVFHMVTDLIDCAFTYNSCSSCLEEGLVLELVKFLLVLCCGSA